MLGVEAEVTQRAFGLFALLYYQLRDHFRVDEDGGVVWVPFDLAAAKARAFLTSRGFDSEPVAAWLRPDSGAFGPAVPDPMQAGGTRLVDADVFAEAVRDYAMAAEDAALDAIVAGIVDTPAAGDGPPAAALPRVLVSLLRQKAPGQKDARPSSAAPGPAQTGPEDPQAADLPTGGGGGGGEADPELEWLVTLAREAAPARDSAGGAGGGMGRLRWALQRFWRTRGRRVRSTLADLRAKERRLRGCLNRFQEAGRRAGPRDVAEAWVLARSMMAQVRPRPGPGSGPRGHVVTRARRPEGDGPRDPRPRAAPPACARRCTSRFSGRFRPCLEGALPFQGSESFP